MILHLIKKTSQYYRIEYYPDLIIFPSCPIIVTSTQMMGMRSGDPPFKNHSNVLVWTDHDDHDSFSLVLKRRLSYLTDLCPILQECTFNFDKHR